jgi:Tfp pilus assembly protein PilF
VSGPILDEAVQYVERRRTDGLPVEVVSMLMWIVLSLALSAPQAAPAQPAADARAQAEQLARSGSHAAALERFQALAAANPDDLDARVWIARLHAWMGNYDRAVGVYESIIATHPQHLDALIGLGDSLVKTGRLREAGVVLTLAESLAPENAAMLAAQGRLHRAAGHLDLSLAYYERALVIDASPAVRLEVDELRRQRAHRIEAGYFLEHFNLEDMPDPQSATGSVNVRVDDRLRVLGMVQFQRKFSINETRGGGGVEWQVRPAVELHGGVLIGDDGLVLPKVDGYGGVNYTRGRATWSFDLRFAEFESIDVQIGGAGLRLALPRQTAAWANYYRFSTDYRVGLSDIVHSWALGTSGHPSPGWTLGVEYTRGPDQLDMLTSDRTGAFEANTYSTFLDLLVTPMASLQARYDYQDRPDDIRVHRATFRIVHRF